MTLYEGLCRGFGHPDTLHPDSGDGLFAGAILVLGRDLVMVPKLIHPLPPNGPGTPKSPAYGEPIEEEPPTPHPMTDTWMQVREAVFTVVVLPCSNLHCVCICSLYVLTCLELDPHWSSV